MAGTTWDTCHELGTRPSWDAGNPKSAGDPNCGWRACSNPMLKALEFPLSDRQIRSPAAARRFHLVKPRPGVCCASTQAFSNLLAVDDQGKEIQRYLAVGRDAPNLLTQHNFGDQILEAVERC